MTEIPLREHIDTLFEEERRYYDRRIGDVEQMIDRALQVLDHRLEEMNHVRTDMAQREAGFITRVEHSEWGKRIDALERFQAKSVGGLGVILLLVPALNALITYIIIHK